ncbi:hypothetical protein ACM614_19590 [Streptomyces sp. 12297]
MLFTIVAGVTAALALYRYLRRRNEQRTSAAGAGPDHKAARAAAAARLGFLPPDRLDTENGSRPDPAGEAVRAAVRDGDWRAAATWLEAAGTDWEERWGRVRLLAEEAAKEDGWLLAWRQASPEDPAAALVHADASVNVAWDVRGSKRASATTQEQFRIFHKLLAEAADACHDAQRLAPAADPVPYMAEQAVAMGLGYGHERYRALWTEITRRDARVLTSYTSALQYWCRKWHGSHELALTFAKEASGEGAPGELLSFVPLYAYFEQEQQEGGLDPDVFYKKPEIVAAVDLALADIAACDADDRRVVRVRHLLAWLLYWQDRYPEALTQFRHVDGWIGQAPWTYSGDPVDRYTGVRDYTAEQVEQAG